MNNYQSSIKMALGLLIGIIMSLQSFSQSYLGFPDSNAVWRINEIGWDFWIPYNPFGTVGDTTIGSLTYKKIGQSIDTSSNISNFQYYCAARDDNGKWYFIPENDSIEYLLYDFSAGVGDTIFINNPWTSGFPEPVKVDSINTVNLYGTLRTHMYVSDLNNNWYPEVWIDGIGSDHGLFYTAEYYFDLGHWLTCFHQNDSLKYLNSPNGECYYSNLSTIDFEDNDVLVYPNPVEEVINFQVPVELKPLSVSIISIQGTVVFQDDFQYQLILDRENIAPGLYIYKILLEDSTTIKGKIQLQ